MHLFVRSIFIVVAVTLLGNPHAISQSNLNFENWTGIEPTGWVSSNPQTMQRGGAQTVFKETTNPGQGNASVKMVTGSCPSCPSYSAFGPWFPPTPLPNPLGGSVQFGSFDNPGIPYNLRPISVNFLYKAKPKTNDAGGFHAELTRYNPVSGETETVGEAYFEANTQVNSWTSVNVPIVYYSNFQPDTLNI